MRRSRLVTCALTVATAAFVTSTGARADTPAPGSYRDGEYDVVRNIDPAGQTGFLTPADAAREKADSTYFAPHQDDQEGMYSDLVTKAPNITAADIQAD